MQSTAQRATCTDSMHKDVIQICGIHAGMVYVPVGCKHARESIKELTARPCVCQQLQYRLNERATRGTHASMQSCRHGALTCMGRVGACAGSSLGVCGVAHKPTNEKETAHTHAHGGQLEQ